MRVTVAVDGSDQDRGHDGEQQSRYWVECPGRATIKLTVAWKPPPPTKDGVGAPRTDDHKREDVANAPPILRVGFFSILGSPSAQMPAFPVQGDQSERISEGAFQAPLFFPLRVRIELQPPYGRPIAHVLHVIPRASARLATAIAVASLIVAAVLLTMQLTTLRVTLLQALSGASGAALLTAAGFVLRAGLNRRVGALPLLGVAHLLQRSLLAVALGFFVLSALLRNYVVVIHNNTGKNIQMILPWRPAPDDIGAYSQISVIPPDGRVFRENVLSYMGPKDTEQPLCILDPDGPRRGGDGCRETATDDPFRAGRWGPMRWFTPPTIQLRCGRRWPGLPARTVLERGSEDLEIEGDTVWFAPAGNCVGESHATLWYRENEADIASHRVRYPWSPATLREHGKLWLAAVDDDERANGTGVQLVSLAPPGEGASRPLVEETRLRVSPGGGGPEGPWPLAGLPPSGEARLTLDIGEVVSRLTDRVVSAATLSCERAQARGTVFRATRLGLRGERAGWLRALEVKAAGGLSSSSSWKLTGNGSRTVATPWICSAHPGENPHLDPGMQTPESLKLVIDADTPLGAQSVALPAKMVPERIAVHDASDALLGHVTCRTTAGEQAVLEVGRVMLDDRRKGAVQRFKVTTTTERWIDETGWNAEDLRTAELPADARQAVWLCWRRDRRPDDSMKVAVTNIATEEKSEATWDLDGGTLELFGRTPTDCYRSQVTGRIQLNKPANKALQRMPDLREFKAHNPDARSCERLFTFDL